MVQFDFRFSELYPALRTIILVFTFPKPLAILYICTWSNISLCISNDHQSSSTNFSSYVLAYSQKILPTPFLAQILFCIVSNLSVSQWSTKARKLKRCGRTYCMHSLRNTYPISGVHRYVLFRIIIRWLKK